MNAVLLAISLVLSQAPAVPLLCAPGDSTVVCHCKQGFASSCEALAAVDAEALEKILSAAAAIAAAKDVEKTKEKSTDTVDTGCGSGQDPEVP